MYVLIHADQDNRIETFAVGPNIAAGERLRWIVEGGKYKAGFLLPDREGGTTSSGLLISETVVPGFEYTDHDFLDRAGLRGVGWGEGGRGSGLACTGSEQTGVSVGALTP